MADLTKKDALAGTDEKAAEFLLKAHEIARSGGIATKEAPAPAVPVAAAVDETPTPIEGLDDFLNDKFGSSEPASTDPQDQRIADLERRLDDALRQQQGPGNNQAPRPVEVPVAPTQQPSAFDQAIARVTEVQPELAEVLTAMRGETQQAAQRYEADRGAMEVQKAQQAAAMVDSQVEKIVAGVKGASLYEVEGMIRRNPAGFRDHEFEKAVAHYARESAKGKRADSKACIADWINLAKRQGAKPVTLPGSTAKKSPVSPATKDAVLDLHKVEDEAKLESLALNIALKTIEGDIPS